MTPVPAGTVLPLPPPSIRPTAGQSWFLTVTHHLLGRRERVWEMSCTLKRHSGGGGGGHVGAPGGPAPPCRYLSDPAEGGLASPSLPTALPAAPPLTSDL